VPYSQSSERLTSDGPLARSLVVYSFRRDSSGSTLRAGTVFPFYKEVMSFILSLLILSSCRVPLTRGLTAGLSRRGGS